MSTASERAASTCALGADVAGRLQVWNGGGGGGGPWWRVGGWLPLARVRRVLAMWVLHLLMLRRQRSCRLARRKLK